MFQPLPAMAATDQLGQRDEHILAPDRPKVEFSGKWRRPISTPAVSRGSSPG